MRVAVRGPSAESVHLPGSSLTACLCLFSTVDLWVSTITFQRVQEQECWPTTRQLLREETQYQLAPLDQRLEVKPWIIACGLVASSRP